MTRIQIVDSHTGGEPTRVVLSGGPALGVGSLAEQVDLFRTRHDFFRSAVVNEPRGSDVLVGRPWASRPTNPVPRASSSSTTSATLACAATARSVWSSRWRIWAESNPANIALKLVLGVVTATLHATGAFRSPTCTVTEGRRCHRGCAGLGTSAAMWPGAATGSFWSRTTGWLWNWAMSKR